MNGIDFLTRDIADMPTSFGYHAYLTWGDDYPISGDTIARIRDERKEQS